MHQVIPDGYNEAPPGTTPEADDVSQMMEFNRELQESGALLALEIMIMVVGFVLLGLVESHAVFAAYPLLETAAGPSTFGSSGSGYEATNDYQESSQSLLSEPGDPGISGFAAAPTLDSGACSGGPSTTRTSAGSSAC